MYIGDIENEDLVSLTHITKILRLSISDAESIFFALSTKVILLRSNSNATSEKYNLCRKERRSQNSIGDA